MKELNDLLDDDSTGGGMIGGHGLTLGMHLLHELQSERKFTDLLTTRYQAFNEINCLSVFHQQLKVYLYLYVSMSFFLFYCLLSIHPFINLFIQTQTESKTYLLPFMQTEDQNSPLSKLYQQVRDAMLHIDKANGAQAAVNQLLKVAEKW